MKQTNLLLMAALLTGFTSCTTDRQFHGTATGAMVGGMFGSSIGGLMGGWRGSDAGTVVGMLVGGAVGNAVTAPATGTRTRDYQAYDDYETYAPKKKKKQAREATRNRVTTTQLDQVEVEDVRFIDTDHNRRLDAGERAKLIFNIFNRSQRTVYNVAPVIYTDQEKQILLSPSAIVSSLEPGQGIRYTADIYARPRLRSGNVTFHIDLTDGTGTVERRVFQLPATGKR